MISGMTSHILRIAQLQAGTSLSRSIQRLPDGLIHACSAVLLAFELISIRLQAVLSQQVDMVLARVGQWPAKDVVWTDSVASCGGLAPTPPDLESPGAGQRDHLVVVRTSGQGLAALLIRFN